MKISLYLMVLTFLLMLSACESDPIPLTTSATKDTPMTHVTPPATARLYQPTIRK